jgi:uncharacterized membrane protein
MRRQVSIRGAFTFAAETLPSNIPLFAGIGLAVVAVSFAISMVAFKVASDTLLAIQIRGFTLKDIPIFALVYLLISAPGLIAAVGAMKVSLMVVDGEKASVTDIFPGFGPVLTYLHGSALVGLNILAIFILYILVTAVLTMAMPAEFAMIGGLAVGVIGFLRVTVNFIMFPYLILDRDLGAKESLEASRKLTDGLQGRIILFSVLALVLTGLSGLLAKVAPTIVVSAVQVVVVFPFVGLAWAHIYRGLQPSTSAGPRGSSQMGRRDDFDDDLDEEASEESMDDSAEA